MAGAGGRAFKRRRHNMNAWMRVRSQVLWQWRLQYTPTAAQRTGCHAEDMDGYEDLGRAATEKGAHHILGYHIACVT